MRYSKFFRCVNDFVLTWIKARIFQVHDALAISEKGLKKLLEVAPAFNGWNFNNLWMVLSSHAVPVTLYQSVIRTELAIGRRRLGQTIGLGCFGEFVKS